ncbi:cell division protein FtsQ [Streptococcus chenjunshii]|uniref:Cell division protein DivIB n=1 Tax=Streptococcus chenjunshii TaxID=2173853 RepID=A0A372KMB5_9STRE|nr:FtsQ-type POTRA domain-containing protein [Streptococcus chenjunshii]AXQ78209.1 cell division protein FtsQ [Streptococcus chenjunshii]RFU50920.1 cell division protein FtsQ [Streptococcus chenjunshii]RFU53417.1 cell division protein FtsQ [Streptococcus chenjunshii]
MAKQKKERKDDTVLTEWQKRNIEFLKRKKKEEEEKKKLKQELQEEKRAQIRKQLNAGSDEENAKEPAADEQKKKKPAKKRQIKKQAKQKRKKHLTKKQRAWRKASPVMVVSLMVLLFSLFLISPYSKRKILNVEGLTHALEEDVLAQSKISDSDYFFSLIFQPAPYEQAIKQANMWVKKAAISYSFPNIFTIKIKEYDVVGYMQTDAGYQPILENGKHAAAVNITELPDNYLIINLENKDDIQTLVKTFASMDKDLISNIKSVDPAATSATADLLSLTMYDGNIVKVPLSEIKTKLPYYSKIKSTLSEPSIIDMEVGLFATTAAIEEAAETAKEEQSEPVPEDGESTADENPETQEESAEEAADDTQETPAESVPEAEAEQ